MRLFAPRDTVLPRRSSLDSQPHTPAPLSLVPLQLFDVDEDERITRQEFTALLRSALGVSDINMAKLFKEIDADASGFITFSEFFPDSAPYSFELQVEVTQPIPPAVVAHAGPFDVGPPKT